MADPTESPQTILIVEDDDSASYIFDAALTHAGYRTIRAPNADVAWKILQEGRPDLVIMDAGLPGMDGFEMTERIRQDERIGDVPILMITVYVFDADVERARTVGCTAFMAKPVQPSLVVQQVRELIGPPSDRVTS
jgi:CheY-like chemotaxis protein